MKKDFILDAMIGMEANDEHGIALILPINEKTYKPSVEFHIYRKGKLTKRCVFKNKDLELFAVNILKSINSKRVLQGKIPYYKINSSNNKK